MSAARSLVITRPTKGLGLLEMAEPDSLNLWDRELEGALLDALDELGDDPSVRVIGLASRGRAFCAGADLKALQDRLASSAPEEEEVAGIRARGITRALAIPKPVIAALNGPCIGIGFAVALTCDLRIASTDLKVQAAFPRRGLIAEHGSAWLLPRIVGLADALDILMTSRTVRADEALAMRLVSRVVEPEALHATLVETAERIVATVSPRALAVIKRQVYGDLQRSLDDAMDDAAHEMVRAFRSPDAAEGVASFLERRDPRFPDPAPADAEGPA